MKIRAPCRGARTQCIQVIRQEEVLRLGVRKSWYLPSNHKLQFDPSSNRQLETTKKRDITDSSRCKNKDLPPSLKHIAVKLGLRTVDLVSQGQVFASNNLQDMYLTAHPQTSNSARAIDSSIKIKEIPGEQMTAQAIGSSQATEKLTAQAVLVTQNVWCRGTLDAWQMSKDGFLHVAVEKER